MLSPLFLLSYLFIFATIAHINNPPITQIIYTANIHITPNAPNAIAPNAITPTNIIANPASTIVAKIIIATIATIVKIVAVVISLSSLDFCFVLLLLNVAKLLLLCFYHYKA